MACSGRNHAIQGATCGLHTSPRKRPERHQTMRWVPAHDRGRQETGCATTASTLQRAGSRPTRREPSGMRRRVPGGMDRRECRDASKAACAAGVRLGEPGGADGREFGLAPEGAMTLTGRRVASGRRRGPSEVRDRVRSRLDRRGPIPGAEAVSCDGTEPTAAEGPNAAAGLATPRLGEPRRPSARRK
jgi:hypothetical protein